ncbi:MAG TPA: hypothetical protein VNO79_03690 [Actinomycetota bacterium]|nr:hypothetical protein [Actinomycetota bacterium]
MASGILPIEARYLPRVRVAFLGCVAIAATALWIGAGPAQDPGKRVPAPAPLVREARPTPPLAIDGGRCRCP